MFRRAVILPTDTAAVWEAITEPGAVACWFGSGVEWDLRPGGRARFRPADGHEREGVVDDVRPGRYLRFRWWPADGSGDVSEIAYELEPDDAGTSLTVTERRVPVEPDRRDARPTTGETPSASSGPRPDPWSGRDQAAWEMWARSAVHADSGLAVCCAR